MDLMCNAVFEGGGVRGIGHVGAAHVLEKYGYKMQNFVGSSAGALVASLFACGYNGCELRDIMMEMDFEKFKQEGILSRLGIGGKALSIFYSYGIYNSDYFEHWLNELLVKKGKRVFGDLKTENKNSAVEWKLQITASDITGQRLLILPRDLKFFGIDADSFSIAKAVRMSISIPIYFKPYKLIDVHGKEHLIVDGGLLSNYPVWIFDENKYFEKVPTIGFKFIDSKGEYSCGIDSKNSHFIRYMKMLAATALDGADKQHISQGRGDFARTISIPVNINLGGKEIKISSTDFNISNEEKQLLYENGSEAARKFLKDWSFEFWFKKYIA